MNDEPLLLGLDCSTHGAKAIAWSPRGEAVAQAHSPFCLENPRSGWWEQNARDWLDGSLEALTSVAREVGSRIVGIGITHQRETFVGVDGINVAVRPAIVWMDERAHEDVDLLRQKLGSETFHRVTGKPLSVTPSVTKISWIRRNEPAAFRRVQRWLDVQAFLVRFLTGEDGTSLGSADPMGLVELGAGTWSDVVLEAAGIDANTLPPILPSGSVVGQLTARVAALTGIPSNTPVVVTAGDGQVAALGAGIADLRSAYLNLGTAIVAGTVSSDYVIDRAFRTMSGAQPDTYLLESDLKGGTFTLDWLRGRLLDRTRSLESLETEAASIPVGSDGLLLLPYLAGVMDPHWDDAASGVLFGLRGDHGPAHLFRSVIEGIAFEERLHLGCIERATKTPLAQVRVLGGGATSDLWCQILADVLGRPVVRTRSPEATSLGAAMLVAVAIGVAPSMADAVRAMGGTGRTFTPGRDQQRYDDLYEAVFVDLYPSLKSAMGKLTRWTRQEQKAEENERE